ncbi:MAG: carboxypeptidase regulatory-like domain-containing protein [Chitinophagaceae bacterium]|nr:carboxypeptidase regulatory-like domain-containing protein [Chitinophagaceae bacterium]
MKRFRWILLIITALCCQFAVKANGGKKNPGDSTVQGSITDTDSKKPVSDVTVSVSSLKQPGKKEVKVTDAAGTFTFPQIRPGEFTIQLEKKGYKTCRKEFIMVKEGIQLKLTLEAEDEDGGIDSWNPLRVLYSK